MPINMKYVTNAWICCAILATAMFVLSIGFTSTAFAEEPEDATNTGTFCDPETDSSCKDTSLEECGKSGSGDCGLFDKYINPMIVFLSAMVGIAVTIGIVSGGIQYAAAGSDPGAVAKARAKIRNSIFALVAFLFLFALVNWLVPGGLG